MISVEEARARVLAPLRRTGVETVSLAQGFGRVLAVPVQARLTQPPADLSAMDGYALRAADGQLGARLRVIGAAPAGHPFAGTVSAGEAVRVFTGSFMPAGADTVLIQEDATAEDGFVTVNEATRLGRHIRPAGQDFVVGDELIPAASVCPPGISGWRRRRIIRGSPCIGGRASRSSRPAMRFRCLARQFGPGGIVSSNAHALAAFIAASGGEAVILPIAGDNLAAMAAGADAARGADFLLTTGGASVGEYDLVQKGFASRGLTLDFWKIAMRPGKPLMFGTLGDLPMLGLPGNPVSAFVCAVLFLRSAIERMSGLPGDAPETEWVRLGAPMKPNDQRDDHVRATLVRDQGGWVATPFPVQDSGMLRTLARADALIRRPAHQAGT